MSEKPSEFTNRLGLPAMSERTLATMATLGAALETARTTASETALEALQAELESEQAEHARLHRAVGLLAKREHLARTGRPAPDGSANEAHRAKAFADELGTLRREVALAAGRVKAIEDAIRVVTERRF